MKKKIAIVSSYNEECGVAFYATRLKAILERRCDVDVLRLNLRLLHSHNRSLRQKGTQHIRNIAAQLKDYDGVVLQMEPGLYAWNLALSYERMLILLRAHPNIVADVHWYYTANEQGLIQTAVAILRRDLIKATRPLMHLLHVRPTLKFWKQVRKLGPKIRIHTFCNSDADYIKEYYGIEDVGVFPIVYYSDYEIDAIRKSAVRKELLNRYGLDENKKYVGVFGFLAPYKGHLVAIKALEYLPDDYHVLIIGGEHPHGLSKGALVPKYLRFINAFINGDEVLPQDMRDLPQGKLEHKTYASRDLNGDPLYKGLIPVRPLKDRVHFPGQPTDEEMARFYSVVDYAVHPYIETETSQAASGPATLAFELAPRALYSNARVFRQMEQFWKGAMKFFGIGNYKELAESILRYDNFAQDVAANRKESRRIYNPETMTDCYFDWFGFAPERAESNTPAPARDVAA